MSIHKSHSLTTNLILNYVLTAFSIVYPLITVPYVSRVLGPEGMGVVSFASSIVSYFTIFAQLGIPIYGVRACAKAQEDIKQLSQTVAELVVINLITCTISYLGFLLVLFSTPRMNEHREIFLILSSSIILNSLGAEWLYKGLEQYAYITIRSLIFKVCSIVMIFWMVQSPEHTSYYAAGTVLALHGSYIINIIDLRKYFPRYIWKQLNLHKHLRPILIFFAMSVSTTIYTHLDSAMLGFMKSDIEVGYYSTATNIKSLLISFIASLGTVLLPRATIYIKKGNLEKFYSLSQKALHFVVLFGTPLAVYFMLFAEESIYFLAGTQFVGAIRPMIIIMPTVLFIGLTNIMGIQMLIPLGRETLVVYSTVIGAVVNIVLNFIWIPCAGASGAAMSTLVAELIVFLYQSCALRECIKQLFNNHCYVRVCIAIILSSIVSIISNNLVYNIFQKLLLSAMLFFGSYLITLLFLKESLLVELKNRILKH